VNQKLSLP